MNKKIIISMSITFIFLIAIIIFLVTFYNKDTHSSTPKNTKITFQDLTPTQQENLRCAYIDEQIADMSSDRLEANKDGGSSIVYIYIQDIAKYKDDDFITKPIDKHTIDKAHELSTPEILAKAKKEVSLNYKTLKLYSCETTNVYKVSFSTDTEEQNVYIYSDGVLKALTKPLKK